MTETLSLYCALSTPYVPVSSQPRLVYLLLEVDDGANAETLPMNLALVVDVSESMHIRLATEDQFEELARMGVLKETLVDGVPAWQSVAVPSDALVRLPRKIDRVQEALRIAVEQLRPIDRFSLVAFARRAVTLVPGTAGSRKRRLLEAIEELSGLRLGDDTYIAPGIAAGFEALQQGAKPGRANRLMVLTDGFAFDEEACRAWARRARQHHLPISTMGLGGEFNEELMIPIADQTGGEAYLLESAEETPKAFAQELRRGQAVRYRGLELKLRPAPGVAVRAAYRVRPSIARLEAVNEGGSYSFLLGDLAPGEEPALLVELIVPPRSPGDYRLAQSLLSYDDVTDDSADTKVRHDITVSYTDDPTQVAERTPHVMRVIEALSAYRLEQGAREDLETGDVASATQKLRAAATRLLDMGEDWLAGELEQHATELEQCGRADPERTKKLRYETRKLTS